MRFLFCILLFSFSTVFSIQTPPTFVVLPIQARPELKVSGAIATDDLIRHLKENGVNAVGTRYLTAALQIEICSTMACMKKIANLVGAKYLVSGSLGGDSVTSTVDFKLFDIGAEKEHCAFNQVIIGGAQALQLYMPELASLLVSSISNTLPANRQTPDHVVAKEPPQTDSVQAFQEEPVDTGSTLKTDHVKVSVKQVKIIEPEEKADAYISDTVPSGDKQLITALSVTFDSPEDTLEKPLQASNPMPARIFEKQDTAADQCDSFQKTAPVLISMPEEPFPANVLKTPAQGDKHQDFAGVRRSMQDPFSWKQEYYKPVRLTGFGALAAAGYIGALVVNGKVRSSLQEESSAFDAYMESDAASADAAYREYSRKTQNTDRLSIQRTWWYFIAGVATVGFTFSVFF